MVKRFVAKISLTLALCLSSAPGFAQEFYLDWAGDSAKINYSPSNTYDASLPWGTDVYWNRDADLLTGLYIATPLEGSGFTEWLFSVKLSLFYLSLDTYNASTLGVSVGFNAGYKFLTTMPTSIILSATLSPDVFNTRNEIDSVSQFSARLQADLSPYLRGYLGYRVYTANLNKGHFPNRDDKVNFEDSLFLGFGLLF